MKVLQLLSTITTFTAFVAAMSSAANKRIDLSSQSSSIARNPQNPQCGDCTAYLDKCLNSCGPKNPKCIKECQADTCTNGPAHCHTGQECAFHVPVCQASDALLPSPATPSVVALEIRQKNPKCKPCDDQLESCWSRCEPGWDWPCRYSCEQSLCLTGAPQCRYGGECGTSCSTPTTLVPLPPTPGACTRCDQMEYNCLRNSCSDMSQECIHTCHVNKCQSPACRNKEECGCGTSSKARRAVKPQPVLTSVEIAMPTRRTMSISTSTTTPVPTATPSNSPPGSCDPCIQYFQDCMDKCPLIECTGYINVCKFKTCNAVGKLCPSDCLIGPGASLEDCPDK